jgi:L,D-transpeptidase YcbB
MQLSRIITAFLLVLALPQSLLAQTALWNVGQTQRLIAWLEDAPNDGLSNFGYRAKQLRQLLHSHDTAAIDSLATKSAIELLKQHRDGCCHMPQHKGWAIASDQTVPLMTSLMAALNNNDIDGLYAWTRPQHGFYAMLRDAYGVEPDPAKRAQIALNMDRWRWMPRDMGRRYVLVNIASYQATLWEDGQPVGRWPVIVGKTTSPTPVFVATVDGVTFNPWWEIPNSIAREGIAALVQRNPAAAARRGYVYQHGRYRQRPGPANALGQMKLRMPNPYNVYLHDTPSRHLFERPVRTFSHGCVRVDDAIGFASQLLNDRKGWSRADADKAVASRLTQTIPLANPIPVYVTYFTAEPDEEGDIRYFPDVYGRERNLVAAANIEECCPS